MIFLKKYIKFRKEKNYVLLCDCSTVTNYELPINTFELLLKLKEGYDTTHPLGVSDEIDIINDLKTLGMLAYKKDSNKGFYVKEWINLDYNESEFFKD